jgi:hypothetical protein
MSSDISKLKTFNYLRYRNGYFDSMGNFIPKEEIHLILNNETIIGTYYFTKN